MSLCQQRELDAIERASSQEQCVSPFVKQKPLICSVLITTQCLLTHPPITLFFPPYLTPTARVVANLREQLVSVSSAAEAATAAAVSAAEDARIWKEREKVCDVALLISV